MEGKQTPWRASKLHGGSLLRVYNREAFAWIVFLYVLATGAAMQNNGQPPMAQGAPMAQAVPQNQNSMDPQKQWVFLLFVFLFWQPRPLCETLCNLQPLSFRQGNQQQMPQTTVINVNGGPRWGAKTCLICILCPWVWPWIHCCKTPLWCTVHWNYALNFCL